ncbi:MAG: squalene/phytoene synthase family protein [Candidatus Eisenbacteria bacterium]|nr:squalene/phytoene synthase family protein [Candidatus Eisenbacteria bacterium]
MTAPLADDRAYCRAVLPRVSRTFALNIRLLPGGLGEAVRTGYLLCRAADALEDSWPGSPAEISARFDLALAAMAGDAAAAEELARGAAALAAGRDDLELVASFPRVWRVWRALPQHDRTALAECVCTLAAGMSRYAARAAARPAGAPYLDSEAELHDYCWVVAGCVGVMLTRLFAARLAETDPARAARRLELAPAVGESLQLTNILLDWPADVRRGRCYVPATWLAERGLSPADLVGADRPGVRDLARRLESLARTALARVPDYVETLPAGALRIRLFCLWPARWALASLEHARRDPEFPWGPRRPRLPRARLWAAALSSLLAHRDGALRRLRGATAAI